MTARRQPAAPWLCALAGALALHLAAFLLIRTHYHRPMDAPPRKALQVAVRVLPPAPPPAPVAVLPAPSVPAPSVVPPRMRKAPAPRPPPPPPAEPAPAPAPQAPQWLDATRADRAPAPQDNRWLLAQDQPWPDAFPHVWIRLWISASGRIERVEIEGAAARDPAVRALFAPIADTPMLPAMIGRVPVPSTMRVELWAGDDGPAPDFVAPLQ